MLLGKAVSLQALLEQDCVAAGFAGEIQFYYRLCLEKAVLWQALLGKGCSAAGFA